MRKLHEGTPTATAGSLAPEPGGASAVVCSGLTYRFGTHTAVDRIDLRIERGETFGLLGPNGAGNPATEKQPWILCTGRGYGPHGRSYHGVTLDEVVTQ